MDAQAPSAKAIFRGQSDGAIRQVVKVWDAHGTVIVATARDAVMIEQACDTKLFQGHRVVVEAAVDLATRMRKFRSMFDM